MRIGADSDYQSNNLYNRFGHDFRLHPEKSTSLGASIADPRPLDPRGKSANPEESRPGQTPKIEGTKEAVGGKIEPKPCQTCASRRYQDSSSDPTASMQSPTRLAPGNEASSVLAHEYQHLAYRQQEAEREGRKVTFQMVRISTSACPECGRIFVSGGQAITTTVPETTSEKPENTAANPFRKGFENFELREPLDRILDAYQRWQAWNNEAGDRSKVPQNTPPPVYQPIYQIDMLA